MASCTCKSVALKWIFSQYSLMDAQPSDLSPIRADHAASAWRGERGTPSLGEIFGSVRTAGKASLWRKLLAFLGPGYAMLGSP